MPRPLDDVVALRKVLWIAWEFSDAYQALGENSWISS
jgi:hypothetical protein